MSPVRHGVIDLLDATRVEEAVATLQTLRAEEREALAMVEIGEANDSKLDRRTVNKE
jgi:hypothetical protein